MGLVERLQPVEGEASLRRNQNPADGKEEKACSGRDVD